MIHSDSDPIPGQLPRLAEGEVVYRQVSPGGNPVFFQADRDPPLNYTLFLPSRADLDGLSLIRQAHRAPVWAAFRPEQPSVRFQLAVVSVSLLQAIDTEAGFSATGYKATPDALDEQQGEPWAHAVAEHINRPAYDRDKARLKSWAKRVAALVSAGSIIGPCPAPAVNDRYRPSQADNGANL